MSEKRCELCGGSGIAIVQFNYGAVEEPCPNGCPEPADLAAAGDRLAEAVDVLRDTIHGTREFQVAILVLDVALAAWHEARGKNG